MKIQIIEEIFSIVRLAPLSSIPEWTENSKFLSITKTDEELSIVCESKYVPDNVQSEKDWYCLKVLGPLDFSLIGILNSITKPLADAKIPIFVISTYDTDYILVKDIEGAKKALGSFIILHY